MDPFNFPTQPPQKPPNPQKKTNQIQGPRPTALKVNQESHKIKKPPLHPQQKPVIIYAVSPKPIHIPESHFMSVVQRLTGLSSGDFSSDGQISPAARLAATEKASPKERLTATSTNENDIINIVEDVEMSSIPGVLSPAPAMLPPVPPGFFSPVTDQNIFNDILINSPYGNSSSYNYSFSPSGLISNNNIFSPLHSPDIFNLLMDF